MKLGIVKPSSLSLQPFPAFNLFPVCLLPSISLLYISIAYCSNTFFQQTMGQIERVSTLYCVSNKGTFDDIVEEAFSVNFSPNLEYKCISGIQRK